VGGVIPSRLYQTGRHQRTVGRFCYYYGGVFRRILLRPITFGYRTLLLYIDWYTLSTAIDHTYIVRYSRLMTEKTKQVAFRFSASLIKRLDAYAEKMARETPGLDPRRAAAVRVILEKGLEEAGFPDDAARKKEKRR
jgi:hypothetical protein